MSGHGPCTPAFRGYECQPNRSRTRIVWILDRRTVLPAAGFADRPETAAAPGGFQSARTAAQNADQASLSLAPRPTTSVPGHDATNPSAVTTTDTLRRSSTTNHLLPPAACRIHPSVPLTRTDRTPEPPPGDQPAGGGDTSTGRQRDE